MMGASGVSAPVLTSGEELREYLLGVVPLAPRSQAGSAAETALLRSLVDIRTAAPAVAVLPPPTWSDPDLRFFVRPEVARRLQDAALALPSDLRLGFWEGLRPVSVQQALWDTALAFLETQHPELSRVERELILERYVARPDSTPPHSTGCAVDIAPVDAFGRALGPTDAWGRLASEALAAALRKAGVFNYEPEWWHWSYGDDEWARANDCAPLSFEETLQFDGPGGGI